jgi:hypothetical protein
MIKTGLRLAQQDLQDLPSFAITLFPGQDD